MKTAFFFFLKDIFIWKTRLQGGGGSSHPLVHAPELSQAETKSQQLWLDLPHGWQRPSAFSGVLAGRWIGSRAASIWTPSKPHLLSPIVHLKLFQNFFVHTTIENRPANYQLFAYNSLPAFLRLVYNICIQYTVKYYGLKWHYFFLFVSFLCLWYSCETQMGLFLFAFILSCFTPLLILINFIV